MANAIIMASGMGTRMRPLTEKIPKPLIQVHGMPMIETVIVALENIQIKHIYVVVGYLGDQFQYLKEKYGNLSIIKNQEYEIINNISSVYAARDVLKKDDCFICEADLYISDPMIMKAELKNSCYFGKMVEGYSNDWVFEQDTAGLITRVGKGGANCYNMVGVAYFRKNDANILKQAVEYTYTKTGYENMFWDDVVNRNLDKLSLYVLPINVGQIIEIDTVAELEVVNGHAGA